MVMKAHKVVLCALAASDIAAAERG